MGYTVGDYIVATGDRTTESNTASAVLTYLGYPGTDQVDTYIADQLSNIGSTTISTAEWGYLGSVDQDLSVGSTVTFVAATITGNYTGEMTILAHAGQKLGLYGATPIARPVKPTLPSNNGIPISHTLSSFYPA